MPILKTKTDNPLFRLILIRPTKYDDDGYVMRYWRGVLPSNTLAALSSLTRQAVADGALGGDVEVEMTLLDELAHRVNPAKIVKRHRRGGARLAVGLVGVQTNQFPRAADLAREFTDLGVPVMMGGFHVSGAIAMSDKMPPELQEMLDYGVTLVKGEVEEAWGGILRDFYTGRRKLFYEITPPPALDKAAIPEARGDYMKKFAYPNMGTIDAGRGCPFSCSFCTIINVQGRKMRARSPEIIASHIREQYHRGVDYYFFTDDNFARNRNWEAVFDALIDLREREGLNITFMMQVDTLACRIKGFCEKARRAGCTQVFIGVETIRESNLDAAGKKQNKAVDYCAMSNTWREHEIAVHTGYIIGFPDDTPQTVSEDIQFLKKEMKIDQASFFILTPLPGSEDHVKLVRAGVPLDPDYNNFDSFHVVAPHPKMSAEVWYQTYLDAWDSFYDFEHMRDSLLRANKRTYWGLFTNYIWYRCSVMDRTHPMIAGLFRLKDRRLRRPGFAVQSRWAHFKMRSREISLTLWQWMKLYYDMQELWLQTRPPHGRFATTMEEMKASLASAAERIAAEAKRLQDAAGQTAEALKDSTVKPLAWLQELGDLKANIDGLSERASREARRLQDAASGTWISIKEGAQNVFAHMRQLDETRTRMRELLESLLSEAQRLQKSAGEGIASVCANLQESLLSLRASAHTGLEHSWQGLAALAQRSPRPHLNVPPLPPRLRDRLKIWSAKGIYTRETLNNYWRDTFAKLRQGRLLAINPILFGFNLLRDVKLSTAFTLHLVAMKTK